MTVEAAISLLLALLNNAGAISQLIQQAQAAGSSTLSSDAWATILANDNTARAQLASAIAAALAANPKPAPPAAA